jgi:hypothetical protein
MRYGWLALTAAGLAAVMPATARACHEERLVQNFYLRYLQRPADPCGLDNWVRQLRCGMPPECVEAAILGSEEYYCLHGHCPRRFVQALYADVLGRAACGDEIEFWACRLRRCGCRKALAKDFLCAARRELSGPPPGFGPPVYAPPVAPVYVPVRPAPVIPPAPGINIRLRYVSR